jgi:hypothetical protein
MALDIDSLQESKRVVTHHGGSEASARPKRVSFRQPTMLFIVRSDLDPEHWFTWLNTLTRAS